MNLPNLLSLLRIFMVAPFLIAVIYDRHGLALVIFVVAGFTDFLDGYLARRLQQKSVLGTFLDPLGDKLLGTVAFIALSVQGLLPAWLAVIVVAKDLYVALGAGILHFNWLRFVVYDAIAATIAPMGVPTQHSSTLGKPDRLSLPIIRPTPRMGRARPSSARLRPQYPATAALDSARIARTTRAVMRDRPALPSPPIARRQPAHRPAAGSARHTHRQPGRAGC